MSYPHYAGGGRRQRQLLWRYRSNSLSATSWFETAARPSPGRVPGRGPVPGQALVSGQGLVSGQVPVSGQRLVTGQVPGQGLVSGLAAG